MFPRKPSPKFFENAVAEGSMGNISCFASGPRMTFTERRRARCRYSGAMDKEVAEITRDKFLALFGPGNQCIERLFVVVDKDKSGKISFREICDAVMTNRTMNAGVMGASRLDVLFKFYDKDADGKLSKYEVADAMLLANDQLLQPQITQLVQTIFGAYDEDRDSHLNFREFSNLMKAAGID